MKVYLVRHGASLSEAENPKKPLSEIGKENCKKVANFLKTLNLSVDTVYHSPKLRAKETAEIISEAFSTKNGLKEYENLKPNDEVNNSKEECINSNENLMFVGHLPFMDYLLSALIFGNESKKIAQFVDASLICIEKTVVDRFAIKWMITPELFSAK